MPEDGGEVAAMVVLVAVGQQLEGRGREKARVGASGVDGRVENDLDETFKQNEHLKDQLLEASLAEDVKNLVITSCMEIRNKDLHDEMERISKESKDLSNESTTADTVCNDAFEVTQELSKRIVELEKDLSKFDTTC
ncbi:hypothetical protein Tco_0401803 [Tanacetum coccineum]